MLPPVWPASCRMPSIMTEKAALAIITEKTMMPSGSIRACISEPRSTRMDQATYKAQLQAWKLQFMDW